MSENKIVKAMLMLCVVMQVAAMMPHHHHADSERVCLNYLHLSDHHDDGCCDDDHGHDNEPFSPCTLHKLVIIEPVRERAEVAIEASVPDDCHCGYCESAHNFAYNWLSDGDIEVELRLQPDVARPLVAYISKVLAPRAPDFIA